MSEYLLQAIYSTLKLYGDSMLTTPASLEVVLAKLSKSSSTEMGAIIAAVKFGAVQELWQNPSADVPALSGSLSIQSGLTIQSARWALGIWQKALDHYRKGQPPPTPRVDHFRKSLGDVPQGQSMRRVFVVTALIMLAGLIAGFLPGVLVAEGIRRDNTQAIRIRQLVEKHEPSGTRMTPSEFAGWIGTLGGIGGLIGAGLGWMAGGFQCTSPMQIIGGIAGAIWAFDGVIFGAVFAGIIGALFGALILAAATTYVATLLGPFAIILFLKPLAWFVLPHFG